MTITARFLLAALSAFAAGAILCAAPAPARAAAASLTPPAQRSYPTRGMSMNEVVARFGEPTRKLAPEPPVSQGPLKPPIERWIYPHFTVYFEHHWVIHTVLTHPHPLPALTHSPAGGG